MKTPSPFCISDPISWDQHRSGWKDCVTAMTKEIHNPNGPIQICTHVETLVFKNKKLKGKWLGFLHNTRQNLTDYPGLEEFISSSWWRIHRSSCQGLCVFSDYIASYLCQQVDVPVHSFFLPTAPAPKFFTVSDFLANPEKKLLFIGHWMRRFSRFFALKSPYQKVLLKYPSFQYKKLPKKIRAVPRLSDADYDNWLSCNMVFLDVHDASANNLVIECMTRNTPILVCRHPAIEEYLGTDYPLYFNSIEEAESKLDIDAIKNAHEYLVELDKAKIDIDYFVESVWQKTTSKIYL